MFFMVDANDSKSIKYGNRSLYIILPIFPLTKDEVQTIAYHDGQYIDDNKSVATHEEKLTLLLQYADSSNCFVDEKD